jgi:hypothetical protein
MFQKVFALCLVASACAAGPAAGNNLRLRGGFAGYGKLTDLPKLLEHAGTENKVKVETKAGGDVKVEANFIATAANSIKSALKAATSVQGVDLEVDLNDSGATNINAQMNNVIDGLKLSLDTSVGAGSKLNDLSSPKISAEYSTGAINAGAAKNGDNVDLSATYAVNDDMSAGVSTSYDTASGSLGDINLAAAYRAGASSVSAVVNGLKGDNVGISATHTVNDDLNVAGHFSTADSKFSLAAGYKIDGDSLVKVNANSDGVVNVGYDRQISGSTKLNAGMEIDANDSSSRKIGVSMTCTV